MGWLLESLIEVLTDLVSGIMGFFVTDFWGKLSIAEVTISGGKAFLDAEMAFDTYLPGAGATEMRTIFKVIGLTIVLLLLLMNLAKGYLPVELSSTIQHPGETIARGAIGALLVMKAYLAVAVIQTPMALVFQEIHGIADKATYMQGNFAGSSTGADIASVNLNFGDQISALAASFITLLLFLALLWGFIQLVAEVVERYVVMCFLFYAAPIGFSAVASKSTENISVNYLRMIFSQYLLMMFNLCFIYVFCYAFTHQNGGRPFGSPNEAIIFYLVLLAWLKLGKSLDEHMRSLGISAAQTGSGLMHQALTGATSAMVAGKMIAGAGKSLFDAGKKGVELGGKAVDAIKNNGSSDPSFAAAMGGNLSAGAKALESLPPSVAGAISKDGLSGNAARQIASEMTGIPVDQIQSANIPSDFASQGMTITGNDGSQTRITPLGGADSAHMNAAGMGDPNVFTNTFDGGGVTWGAAPVDSAPSTNGIMAHSVGHEKLGTTLGVDPASASGIANYNVTVDSNMSQKYGVPQGNYTVFDTNTYNAPGKEVSVHHSQINGRDVSFVNREDFKGFKPTMKGYFSNSSSGTEAMSSKFNA